MRTILLATLLILAACESEPENIQAKAEDAAKMLENRAAAIGAEAENGTEAAVQALDNETAALFNQAGALAAAAENRSEADNRQ